jgi:hypothetical protein
MKAMNVQQVEGGYIVASEDYKVKIFTNFGAVVKELRKTFGEEIVKGENAPTPAAEVN